MNLAKCLAEPDNPALTRRLVDDPVAAYELLTSYAGPYPDGMDPRDAGPALSTLLARIASAVPERMVDGMLRGFWAARCLVMDGAVKSGDPRFVPHVIACITDRSLYVRSHAVHLMDHYPHLQRRSALAAVERFLGYEATRENPDDVDRGERVAELLRALPPVGGTLSPQTVELLNACFADDAQRVMLAERLELDVLDDHDDPAWQDRVRFSLVRLIVDNHDNDWVDVAFDLMRTDWRDLFVVAEHGDDLNAHVEWAERTIREKPRVILSAREPLPLHIDGTGHGECPSCGFRFRVAAPDLWYGNRHRRCMHPLVIVDDPTGAL